MMERKCKNNQTFLLWFSVSWWFLANLNHLSSSSGLQLLSITMKGHLAPYFSSLLGDPPLFSADWKASAISRQVLVPTMLWTNCLPRQNVHFWPNKQMSKVHTVQTTGQRTCLQKVVGDILCSFNSEWTAAFRRLVLHLQGALESWAGLVKRQNAGQSTPEFLIPGMRAWEFAYHSLDNVNAAGGSVLLRTTVVKIVL